MLSAGGGPAGEGEVRARTLTPDEALLDYLQDHGLSRISKRLVSSGALDVVATAAPGIKDILILGKVKQLERAGDADLIVLDAPAAGHAITFLQSAQRAPRHGAGRPDQRPGPGRARDAHRPRRAAGSCSSRSPRRRRSTSSSTRPSASRTGSAWASARSWSTASTTICRAWSPSPAEAAAAAGATLRAGEADGLAAAAAFRADRMALQVEQVGRLADQLPLAQIRLPFVFTAEIGPAELEQLADRLLAEVDALPEVV